MLSGKTLISLKKKLFKTPAIKIYEKKMIINLSIVRKLIFKISFHRKKIAQKRNNKILMFNTRLPAIKLIGIKENKEFIKKASKLIFFDEINIFNNIKYNLHYFNINIILNFFNENIIAPVAQLDRALGYGPGGSGFKS
tara:strand:- start:472 stop:888 length:417 start_codon:yes stop_codon:yes gene_type:complete